ncbi:type II toxin-antitoxin system mRNA interferase toxin, RelE/StbE family [Marispirochaeta sp.]
MNIVSSQKNITIEPNWLLMYRIEHSTIIFTRTGSHSKLFE